MTIKVEWSNPEKTIILQKRAPGWTWKDFDAAVDQYVAMARSVDHRVAIIIDCLDAPNSPTPSALYHYQRAESLKPENLVLMVVVSTGGFLEEMGRAFDGARRGGYRFLHFVRSMEEAEVLTTKVLTAPASDAE
jgi:hypothetical protein